MISTPNRNQELFLYSVLAALMALPFISDLLLPLGTAVWVIYIFPVALAYLARAPFVPLILAAMATILTAVGYMWGPVGVEPEIALINRILGVITAWVVAALGYLFIRTRVSLRRHEWLQAGQVGLAGKMNGEHRSAEQPSELQSLMRISDAAFCVKK